MCCDHPLTANIIIAQLNPGGVSQENRNLSRSLMLLSTGVNTEGECGHRGQTAAIFHIWEFAPLSCLSGLWNAQVFLKLPSLGISQSEQHVITNHVKNK